MDKILLALDSENMHNQYLQDIDLTFVKNLEREILHWLIIF